MSPDDVTIGELYRSLDSFKAECREAFRDLGKDVSGTKIVVEVERPKVRRLETIVYGTGAMAAAALITAVLGLVINTR